MIVAALRWFWLNLLLILVCTWIAFWSFVYSATRRLQLKLRRLPWLPVILITFTGCAHEAARPVNIAPSMSSVSIPLQGTRDAIAVAQDRLKAGDLGDTASALSVASSKAEVTAQALQITQRNVDSLEAKLGSADAVIASQKAELHEVAKERDILPFLVALCIALWLVFFTDGLPIPDQYRYWVKIGAFFVGFGAGYAMGRTIVRFIAGFLP